MNNDIAGLDRVENTEGKSGHEKTAERSKLHRTRFGVTGDASNRGIDTAEEVKSRSGLATLIPESCFCYVLLCPATDDETKAH